MSPRTKNTPEDWKRTRFCAHTHKKKARARVLIAALLCHRHASIDRFRPVHRHFLAGSRWFRWTDDTRETDIEIAFFPIGFFFDARCTAIFPSALRSIQNALEAKKTPNKLSTRARENTQKTHTEREEEEEDKEEKKQRRRTRVLLDFRFHPSVQSVVERFQKRRPVHVSSRFGCRRRRRQRRDRRRARDRFRQATIIRAAFFAAAAHDDDVSRPSCSLLYRERESFEEILIGL